MKKLTSALALVAVAASLVACGKPEEKKPEVKVEAPKVVEETSKTTTTSTTSAAPGMATTASTTTTTTTTTTSAPATK
jgi:predicted small lipoprotein YifL